MMYFFKVDFDCTNSDDRYPVMQRETRFITIGEGSDLQGNIDRIQRELGNKYKRVNLVNVENISTPLRKR